MQIQGQIASRVLSISALALCGWTAGCMGLDDGATDDASKSTATVTQALNNDYPPGPYGPEIGQVLDPAWTWIGNAPGTPDYVATTSTTVPSFGARDFYDPDGTKKINAVLFDYVAGWCPGCRESTAELPALMQTWAPKGITVVDLILEKTSRDPADISFVKTWRNKYKLNNIAYVGADPDWTMRTENATFIPYLILVDPRTMKILKTSGDGDVTDNDVVELANKNSSNLAQP